MPTELNPPLKQWSFGTISDGGCVPCSCFCGYVLVEDSGGDEGFGLSFPVSTGAHTNATFRILGHRGGTIADQIKVTDGTTTLYESDCAATDFDSGTTSIPAGTTTMVITVTPHCAGGSGTVWDFNFGVTCT